MAEKQLKVFNFLGHHGKANLNDFEIFLPQSEGTRLIKTNDSRCCRECWERVTYSSMMRCNLIQTLLKSVWGFIKKLKTDLSQNLDIPLLGHKPLLGIYPKDSILLQCYLLLHVNCSSNHNSK